MKHLFLTGDKQVGKSTLLEAILREALSGRYGTVALAGGFRTVKATGILPGKTTLHLLDAAKKEKPSRANLIFVCREGFRTEEEQEEITRRFEAMGVSALQNAREAAKRSAKCCILMDELGPNEESAEAFHEEVLKTLDGNASVFGVLQKANSDFLSAVAHHPEVKLVTVTPENRKQLSDSIEELIPDSLRES